MGAHCRDHRRRQRRGLVISELIVGMVLILLTAMLAAKGAFDYQRAASSNDLIRAALWAADAQLRRFQAGAPLDSLPPKGLIDPEVTLTTTHAPAEGQWTGFQLVTVEGQVLMPTGRPLTVQARGYVPSEEQP